MPRSAENPDPRRRLLDTWRAARRAVLRRRRLLAAACLGAAVLAGLRAVSPAPEPTVEVLVAAHDLDAGAVLGPSDLATEDWPAGAAPSRVARATEALGRTITGPVRSGEPVTDVRLVGESLLEGYPDLEAVPIRIPDSQAAGLLRVGMRIDLLATDPRSGDTTRVGEDVPILALPHQGVPPQGNPTPGRLLVVGTTPEMSENVASATVTHHLTALISR
ncbi:MAG: SAF domain-containing protein [Nocardioides sp.]|nr:SAF domain-containing protein [Nocardioides sp.]